MVAFLIPEKDSEKQLLEIIKPERTGKSNIQILIARPTMKFCVIVTKKAEFEKIKWKKRRHRLKSCYQERQTEPAITGI